MSYVEVSNICLVQSSLPVLSMCCKKMEYYPNLVASTCSRSRLMTSMLKLETGYA